MRVNPIGDSALQLRVTDSAGHDALRRARLLADHLFQSRPSIVQDVVAAYAEVTVYFDPGDREQVFAWVKRTITTPEFSQATPPRGPATVRVPVCHGSDFAPDIRKLADRVGRSPQDVFELYVSQTYSVAAIGFLPGFAYLAGLDELLHAPRLDVPRPRVRAGSVGIGGSQTGIYPCDSPGGWNIIGRTPLTLFRPERTPAAALRCGDIVRFTPITLREFDRWK